jgi:hypothetical protein
MLCTCSIVYHQSFLAQKGIISRDKVKQESVSYYFYCRGTTTRINPTSGNGTFLLDWQKRRHCHQGPATRPASA